MATGHVAVIAQKTEAIFGKALIPEIAVQMCHSAALKLFAVFCPVAVRVVYRQKLLSGFSAASAARAICSQDRLSQCFAVFVLSFFVAFRVVSLPACGLFSVFIAPSLVVVSLVQFCSQGVFGAPGSVSFHTA